MTEPDQGQSFREVVAESRQLVDRLGRLRGQAEQVSVTETSPDGGITVTVNSGGVPIDLRITDQAVDQPGARVAAEVMATMRKAQARIAARMSEVMADDDPGLRDRVLAVYHDRFPDPEPAKPVASPSEDDDDEDGGSIFGNGYR